MCLNLQAQPLPPPPKRAVVSQASGQSSGETVCMPASSSGCEPELPVDGCKAKSAPAEAVPVRPFLQTGDATGVFDFQDMGVIIVCFTTRAWVQEKYARFSL